MIKEKPKSQCLNQKQTIEIIKYVPSLQVEFSSSFLSFYVLNAWFSPVFVDYILVSS